MRALTVSEIIQLWETACRYHPVDRALCMLQPVLPDQSRDELAALTIGQRDALLLALRQATFGDLLAGVSHCPECASTVEFELSCHSLCSGVTAPHPEQLNESGYKLMIRPLNSFDLAEAAMAESETGSRAILIQRCVSEALYHNQTVTLEALPREVEERIAEAALAADTQAETLLDLSCPDCRHQWQSVLDIAHILWLEISARAQRLLFEVHVLAKAYNWCETEILELSPQRRATYLQMATA